ncbi:hypothetical protein [Pseudomonas sp. NBRC 111137]|uniref:hypothetical protein n=1 Tax=Pseudomonas sp. NBRC 111137 TaxID=1661052 RepID=UPI0006D41288|nr:hypothetical protein [Pseudomonas sp. NBRC 111137]
MKKIRFLNLVACLVTTSSYALEQGEYRLNGFGTVGITHLGGEEHGRSYGVAGQTNDSWRGDQLSKLGGQIQYGLTDTIGLTLQATVKPEQDNWKANLEWAYVSWQANDRLILRTGRLRNPVYMYSETLDVGFTYPWLRLPDEVYSQVQLSNYEGADAVYTIPLSFGALTFQVGGGQAVNRNIFGLDKLYDIDYKKIFTSNVSLATNRFGTLRISYTEADIDSDYNAVVRTSSGESSNVSFGSLNKQKGKFASVGYQYDNGTWLTSNELTRRVIEADGEGASKAFYLMGGRRFGDFLVHTTYAQLDEGKGRQSSWAYGLNYNITPTVIVKGEYKRVDTSGKFNGVFIESAQESYDHAGYAASNGFSGTPSRNYDGDIISVGVDFVF